MDDPDGPWAEIKMDLEDPHDELTEEYLQLNLADPEDMIDVWYSTSRETEILSGTTWEIATTTIPFSIFVEGKAAGQTELVLTLRDATAERPISDSLIITVAD